MTRSDRLALLISLLAVLAAAIVTDRVYERLPHIEDEVAYAWQATVIANGQLTIPSPPQPKSFLVPFVIDYQGQRFGKYPPAWPALLAIGVRLGGRFLVNPLLAGLGVWLTYRLGKRLSSELAGLLAAGLTLTSPFFLMNSGSLLSHSFGLVLGAAFALAWLDAFTGPLSRHFRGVQPVSPTPSSPPPRVGKDHRWLATLVAALSLGVLILTRPMTAVAVCFPFTLHGVYLLVRGDAHTRRRLIVLGIVTVALASLYFVWQYAVTGDPLLNPYTLWWPYDKVGFGPGYGHASGGHNLIHAYINTDESLSAGYSDLFGWWRYSWIFLPFGLWAARRNRSAWLVGSIFPSLVLFYSAYWIGSSLYGPRYYYEGLYSLTIFSAAGIMWLAGWSSARVVAPAGTGTAGGVLGRWLGHLRRVNWRRIRALSVTALLTLLVSINLLFYTPVRLGGMYGLYQIKRADLQPFLTPQTLALTPALVIVYSDHWMPYGALIQLEDPYLTTPFIFAWSMTPEIDASLSAYFPGRSVYHYYPDEPGVFYDAPRPTSHPGGETPVK